MKNQHGCSETGLARSLHALKLFIKSNLYDQWPALRHPMKPYISRWSSESTIRQHAFTKVWWLRRSTSFQFSKDWGRHWRRLTLKCWSLTLSLNDQSTTIATTYSIRCRENQQGQKAAWAINRPEKSCPTQSRLMILSASSSTTGTSTHHNQLTIVL